MCLNAVNSMAGSLVYYYCLPEDLIQIHVYIYMCIFIYTYVCVYVYSVHGTEYQLLDTVWGLGWAR